MTDFNLDEFEKELNEAMKIHGKDGYCPLAATLKMRGFETNFVCGTHFASRILEIPHTVGEAIADGFDGHEKDFRECGSLELKAYHIGTQFREEY